MPGAARMLDVLHVRTERETIRRQLLVHPGEPLDTLRALESIHRLKRQPYLTGVSLELQSCADSAGVSTVEMRVVTKDSWSTQPTIKVRSSRSAIVGVEERNILGTGRSVKTYVRSDHGRLGLGAAYSDPWVFDSPLAATLSRNFYRDGEDWRVALGSRQRSVFDTWNSELTVSESKRISLTAPVDSLRRSKANFLVSHLWLSSPTGATSILSGVEGEYTRLSVANTTDVVGPTSVYRKFVGVDLGLSHRSALYQSVDWYLPGGASTDFPVGFEGEGIVGAGRDLASQSPALHVDVWGGRIWTPRPDLLVAADLWQYGFVEDGSWQAGTTRAALSLFKPARRGLWTSTVDIEQLTDPDPDVGALSSMDFTVGAIPRQSRLAERAVAMSLERSLHLFGVTHSYVLDGALFGAASSRWDPAPPNSERVSLAVLGGGFRLTPTHLGRMSLRLDAGYPVAASSFLPRRPFVRLTLVPWIEAGRVRLGLEQR